MRRETIHHGFYIRVVDDVITIWDRDGNELQTLMSVAGTVVWHDHVDCAKQWVDNYIAATS